MKYCTGFIALLLMTGCAIRQDVQPYTLGSNFVEVCIIEDEAVRPGFLQQYQRSLRDRGIDYQILESTSSLNDCLVTSTYTARWSWDMALYMSYAEIIVYEASQLVGSAVYDSRSGSFRLDKWQDAEPKIDELVGELFLSSN